MLSTVAPPQEAADVGYVQYVIGLTFIGAYIMHVYMGLGL